MALGLALWCLHVEIKPIRLSVGSFRKLLDEVKLYCPEFRDPGASSAGKIKFNLQMVACIVGWLGLVYFPADPTAILLMACTLFAARHFGDRSLGWHRQEYMSILWSYFALLYGHEPKLDAITADDPDCDLLQFGKSA